MRPRRPLPLPLAPALSVVLALTACGEATLNAPTASVLELQDQGRRLDAQAARDGGARDGGARDQAVSDDAFAQDASADAGQARDQGPTPDRGVAPPPQDMAPPPQDLAPPPRDLAPPAPATCESGDWQVTVNGQPRRVRFDLPADPGQGAPRVLLLHGNGDNANNFCATTGLCRFLTGRGALVATPDARQRVLHLPDGRDANLAWDAYDTTAANEDYALGEAILAELDRRCGAGPFYVWGHSQGGYFGFMFAMTHDTFGAVISAASDPMGGFLRDPPRPFALGLIIGTLDYGLAPARQTVQRMEAAGHRVLAIEVEGARHAGYLGGHDPELADFVGLR